ncbi:MAG: isoprenylcysteine carboxylmethyltransferase family protein [Thermodesulfobacteriota bacterium]
MALREEFNKQGNWLFRWRSYLPLVMIIIVLLGMSYFEYPGHNETYDDIWEIACMFISFLGVGIRFFTVGYTPEGTSGTNTRRQIADRLNTVGMYSVVRHPLYLGNFIIWFGLSAFFHLWWFSLIVMLIFWLYYERIMFAEEEYLREKFGDNYSQWAEKTPAFIPDMRKWSSSDTAFSFRKAIKNEYKSIFAIIVAFLILEITGDIFVEQKFEIDKMWLSILITGSIMYVIIRFLKKKTKILDDQ